MSMVFDVCAIGDIPLLVSMEPTPLGKDSPLKKLSEVLVNPSFQV